MRQFKTTLAAITAAALVSCAPAPVTANESEGITKAEYCEYAANFAHTVATWKDGDIAQKTVVAAITDQEAFDDAPKKEQTLIRDYISQVYYWDWNPDESYEKVYFKCFNYDV